MQQTPTVTTEHADDKLSDKKLRLAGFSYMLGDAAMVAAGAAREGRGAIKGGIGGGALWFAGGAAMAHYGNPDAEKRLQILADKLEKHLQQHNITIPASVREQSALLKDKSFWEKIENFLYEHPSEILNSAYALGAGLLLHHGVQQARAGSHSILPSKTNQLATDFWIGAAVLTGALGGLLLKEDPQAREKAKDGNFIDKAKAWVTEKPLRFSGTMYTINNGFLAWKAKQDFSDRHVKYSGSSVKPHVFSSLQLATYLFSNAMLLMSSRNQLTQDIPEDHVRQLEDAAARMIAAQPAPVQQALLAEASEYLAKQKGINQPAAELAKTMADRVVELTGERMQQATNSMGWAQREQQRAAQTAPAAAIGA